MCFLVASSFCVPTATRPRFYTHSLQEGNLQWKIDSHRPRFYTHSLQEGNLQWKIDSHSPCQTPSKLSLYWFQCLYEYSLESVLLLEPMSLTYCSDLSYVFKCLKNYLSTKAVESIVSRTFIILWTFKYISTVSVHRSESVPCCIVVLRQLEFQLDHYQVQTGHHHDNSVTAKLGSTACCFFAVLKSSIKLHCLFIF